MACPLQAQDIVSIFTTTKELEKEKRTKAELEEVRHEYIQTPKKQGLLQLATDSPAFYMVRIVLLAPHTAHHTRQHLQVALHPLRPVSRRLLPETSK